MQRQSIFLVDGKQILSVLWLIAFVVFKCGWSLPPVVSSSSQLLCPIACGGEIVGQVGQVGIA